MTISRWTAIAGLVMAFSTPLTSHAQEPTDWLRRALREACPAFPTDGLSLQSKLDGAWLLDEDNTQPHQSVFTFALADQHELRLSYLAVRGALRRFRAELYKVNSDALGSRPLMQIQTDGNCAVRTARRIRREASGHIMLDHMDDDLKTPLWVETLEAPWPAGTDPGGPRVALIDSGLAYDLPAFRNRLARDKAGIPLGYDFWDLDPLPYDGDTARSVFQPIRHGTPVAFILAREAPSAALIPFRYPRPDMNRLGDIIARIADSGARIIAMPLGSRRKSDWVRFEAAMKAHPELLAIVSAGNDGRDIDADPLWPAALDLDNMIVVTSSDAQGRLAPGSNWGPASVDIMVPGENQPVIDFRGSKGRASGTSYAVPRVAALAARLLQKSPDLTIAALKTKILNRTITSPESTLVTSGWIIDPHRD